MKQIVAIVLFFMGMLASSQESDVILRLNAFKEVKGFDGLSIRLIKSTENKAIISGENTGSVAIVNNDGVLKIRMQIGKIFSGYKTFVDLHYTGTLVVIDVNEDARMITEGMVKQEILELRAQEGGELVVTADVDQMLIKCVSGGIIRTSGYAGLQDVQINTGGVYEGRNLSTKFSTINVNAGSRAEINAKDYVKATVKAGGEVLVYGNPTKLEEKTVFGGTIKRM